MIVVAHGKWLDQVEGTGTGEILSVRMRLDRMGWCGMIELFIADGRREKFRSSVVPPYPILFDVTIALFYLQ